MKKIVIIALGVGLLAGACSKDFLDTDSTRFMSKDDIDRISDESPHLADATLNGLYASLVKVGVGGTTGHDDFGQKGIDIYTDMLSSDMTLSTNTYNWYRDLTNLTATVDFTNTKNYVPWRFYYYVIRGANNVIEGLVDENGNPKTEESRFALGQGLALRAYAYFYLTELYTLGYDANEKKLPIYTEPILENVGPSPTQEVFDLMIADLEKAIELLDGFGGSKQTITKEVAEGILAYVYAARGTGDAWVRVQQLTDNIISGNRFPLTTKEQLTGGFNNLTNPSWMWGADITLENGLDLISWWGQIDLFTYSYAWAGDEKGIDDGLYAQIKDTDVRKEQFVDAYEDGVLWPINKFYDPAKEVGGQRLIETDYIYMRVDEMYLLNVEALANLGQDGEAVSRLKELMEIRMDDVSYLEGLSGQVLKDEIYLQTRIEFWGEGKSYLAMKRNKATTTRGNNHLYLKGQSFQYDDPRLTFEIPQEEILNNPFF